MTGILVLMRAFGVLFVRFFVAGIGSTLAQVKAADFRFAGVLGILPALGEIGIVSVEQRVLVAMRELATKRFVAFLPRSFLLHRAFAAEFVFSEVVHASGDGGARAGVV